MGFTYIKILRYILGIYFDLEDFSKLIDKKILMIFRYVGCEEKKIGYLVRKYYCFVCFQYKLNFYA